MMTNRFYVPVLLLLSFCATRAFGQKPSGYDFAENKGQWADSIRYAAQIPGGLLHIGDGGFAYYYASETDMQRIEKRKEAGRNVDSEQVHLHHYRLSYVDANEDITYSTAEVRSNYINYFRGNDRSEWRGNIGLYGELTQHNIYDGIAVKIYSKGSSLKYDFILAPGADPQKIRLRFEGVNPQIMPGGKLKITTTVNEVTEQAPYAYQLINGTEVAVPCHFQLNNNELSFSLPRGYDTSYPLIIDPELVFTTFSGAGDFYSGYFSFCTTYDQEGCLYAAGVPIRGLGWTLPPQWPVTPGAFQTSWTTIYEPMICLNKYSSDGSNLLYSTYYGGAGPSDLPHSMIVNDQNELVLAGSTGSFNLPVTIGCFDSTKSGGTDIFIAHFNSTGTALVGATYVGGNIGNSINPIDMFSTSGFSNQNKTSPVELALDSAGNIWVVSNTSTSDFPVTANAFQPTIGGGNADGVVFALNPQCSQMVYGSFAGGNNTDVAYGIQVNKEGKVVICGGTKSSNFPTTTGAFKTIAPGTGAWDGFVMTIDPQSGNLLSSSYLGTEMDDQATHVQVDVSGNVYVLGRTFGNYPISPGVYSVSGSDLFIQKLDPGLTSSSLSTRLGSPQSGGTPFFPTAFLVDNCTNVYVTGLSSDYEVPLANMPLTQNAFQTTPGNFWFGVLRPGFSDLLFGTYYGRVHDPVTGINGDHTHVGANHFDPQGILYQSLCVNSNDYPGTTSQSWSQFNQNTAGQDIVSFKFAFQLAGVTADFDLQGGQSDSGCAPFTVQLENSSTMAMEYYWDFGDGSTSTDPNPTHTYQNEGSFTLSLHAHNDTTCITDAISTRTITVYDPQVPDITVPDTLVCNYEQAIPLTVTVNNPSSHNRYLWEAASGISGPADQQTVTVDPNLETVYSITVWDTIPGFCGYRKTDTVHINYKPRALDIIDSDTLICKGTVLRLTVTGTDGYSYLWSPQTGVTSPTSQSPDIAADSSTSYTVTASYPGCADTAQSIRIDVDNPMAASFETDPDSICTGSTITFLPQTGSTTTALHWQWGDGTEMIGSNERSFRHAYDSAGSLAVRLTAQFRACPDTSFTQMVYVYALPKVYLGPDSGLCLDGSPIVIQNRESEPNVAHHYLWNTGDTTQSLEVVHPGIYSLRVSNEPLGCSTTETIEISKDCYMDIPNAFTPNGDGENDYFFPRQLLSGSLTRFRMQVFNRWGQQVFETASTDGRGWDGTFNGQPQPQGVYIYRVEGSFVNGRQEHYQGNVTLLR